jgi:hypothetical protein
MPTKAEKRRLKRQAKRKQNAVEKTELKALDQVAKAAGEDLPSVLAKRQKRKEKQLNKKIAADHAINREKAVAEAKAGYPYRTDAADHCETPLDAYEDIAPLLEMLAELLGKSKEELLIWDPYYCDGSTVDKFAQLGFHNVYNKKEDCYAVFKDPARIPDYDILVTNPAWSGDHIEKIYRFCIQSKKPWLLLVPNYVYMKPYFQDNLNVAKPFYLTPATRYRYWTPLGHRDIATKNRRTSPFLTFWYGSRSSFAGEMKVETGMQEFLAEEAAENSTGAENGMFFHSKDLPNKYKCEEDSSASSKNHKRKGKHSHQKADKKRKH